MRRPVLIVLAAVLGLVALLWATNVWSPFGDAETRTAGRGVEPLRPRSETPDRGSSGPALEGREAVTAPSARPTLTGPRITGRVVDSQRKGVPNARVIAASDVLASTFVAEEAGGDGAPTTVATSEADGRFEIAVSSEALFHILWADAPGHGFAVVNNVTRGDDVVLELEPAVTLSGMVKDGGGKPIAGAKVKAMVLLDCRKVVVEVTSDASGAYRIAGLPAVGSRPGKPWRDNFARAWFEVSANEFAPLLVENVLEVATSAEHRQDFTLLGGGTLAGRVENAETGRPVAGAQVVLHSIEGMQQLGRGTGVSFANPWSPRVVARTSSAEDGSFLFEHVPCMGPHGSASHNSSERGKPSLGGVTAWHEGTSAASENLDVPQDGERQEVVLRLWPAAAITGRVIEKDGTPAGGVIVSAKVADREVKGYIPPVVQGVPRAYATSEDATGRFRIEAVQATAGGPTDVALSIYRLARGPRVPPVQPSSSAAVVRAGETLDVGDLTIEPLDLLPVTTVLVRRQDGSPISGAQVSAGFLRDTRRTDASGRAEWVWQRPRGGKAFPDVKVVVKAKGFAPAPATLSPPGSGRDEVEVTLRSAHRLAGVVLGWDGRPEPEVTVNVADGTVPLADAFPERKSFMIVDDQLPKNRTMPISYGSAVTDREGRFVVEDLPDGPYHVLASRGRRVPTAERSGVLRVEERDVVADRDDVVLRLPLDDSPEAGSLQSSVVEAGTGRPVATAQVVLSRAGSVAAVVMPPNMGRDPPPPVFSRLEPSGVFRVSPLAVGAYSIRVIASGFRPRDIENIVIGAGETIQLPPIELDRGIVVSGRVSAPAGVDLATRVVWFRLPGKDTVRTPLSQDGSFRATGLDPGTWRPLLVTERWTPAGGSTLVPSGEGTLILKEGDREARFDATWIVAGKIDLQPSDPRFPAWGPKATATPEQESFSSGSRIVLRAADGRTLFERSGGIRTGYVETGGWEWLPPGRYVARLETPDGKVREQAVEVAAGATVTAFPAE